MDSTQKLLFAPFPRNGATPHRVSLVSERHFDWFVEEAGKEHNLYCSIAQMPPSGPRVDKVPFDLDAEADDVFADHVLEPERFRVMREDEDIAHRVLGDVVDDMRSLAKRSYEDGIPTVGVFSGMGVHIYQLYQEAQSPKNQVISTGNKYSEELELKTIDKQCFGVMRIMRIPNCLRRFNGDSTAVWTIPLTAEEMMNWGVMDLLEHSTMPRTPPLPSSLFEMDERPEMEVYEDYLRQTGRSVPEREISPREGWSIEEDWAEYIVESMVKPPCIRERILASDPHHKVRLNFAVLLFNFGFSPDEVHEIIKGLNWVDYDRRETEKQLRQIWSRKYGDWSCKKLKNEGFCRRSDNPRGCEAYGWSGGNQFY